MVADLRARLQKEFDKNDTSKTGKIATKELEALLKRLNPDFTEEELKLIFSKLKIEDGKIAFSEFLDLFAGEAPKSPRKTNVMNKALAKQPNPEELEVIKDAFKRYDKDSSDQIDLKELKAMCEDLGKKLSDEQASAAMQQLDRDGNMQVSFEEFLLWYTTTPEAGGYSHMALKFMKAKLRMEGGIRKIKKRTKKAVENIDEFTFRGCVDASPDLEKPSKEACSATLKMSKAEAISNKKPALTLVMSAKDPETAASCKASIEAFLKTEELAAAAEEMVSLRQENEKLHLLISAPEEMFVEIEEAVTFLQDCVKKTEVKLSLGVSFEEILKNPNKPLLMHFQGVKMTSDIVIGLSALLNMWSKTELPPEVQALVKIFAAVCPEVKICYNESSIMIAAGKLKDMFKQDEYKYRHPLKPLKIAMGNLHDARALMYSQMEKEGTIQNGKWSDRRLAQERFEPLYNVIRTLGKGITGIDSLTLDGIPGSTVQFTVDFENVNPFPLFDWFCGSYPKNPAGDQAVLLQRTQSNEEAGRLRQVFDEFDRDKSGAIDIKELKQMIEQLGGTITHEELEEAMLQLDTNKDGTCSFEEFKAFWSSKPNLGGYSSLTLRFLKTKLQATNMFSKASRFLGGASGYVGEPSKADTVIKFGFETAPGLETVPEKMSLRIGIDQVLKQAVGPPVYSIVVGATDNGKAVQAVEVLKSMMAPSADMIELIAGQLPKIEAKGKTVTISMSPPDEMVQMIYQMEDLMQSIVPLVQGLKTSNIKLTLGNDFMSLLGAPDKSVFEVWNGVGVQAELCLEDKAKQIFLGSLPGQSQVECQLFKSMLSLFSGAEIKFVTGLHRERMMQASKINDMVASASTPEGLRQMLATLMPFENVPIEEVKPYVEQWEKLSGLLEGLESVSFSNVDLPAKFAADGKPATIGVCMTATNMKMFDFYKFMAEPMVSKFHAVAGN